jgi:Beta-propeller repeat
MIARVIAQRWMSGWTALGALATVAVGGACAMAVGGPSSAPHHAAAAPRMAGPARLAMSFEANRGQAPHAVDFLAHGDGFAVGLGRGTVRVALSSQQGRLSHVRLATPGGRLGTPVAAGPRAGRVSYLVGDRSRWLRDVPTFSGVRYRAVWPGIDLAFRGTDGSLEYDLDVAAHADPRAIDLTLPGATSVRGDGHGGALVHARGGATLRMAPPVSFQRGSAGQTPVASRLVVGNGHVRVALGAYDRSQALVIDPSVAFSTFGGGHSSIATGVGADAANNVYVTGNAAQGDDLTTTAGSVQGTYGGGYDDVFVEKLNPSGTAVQYATYLGSTHEDYAYGLAVDGAGNTYITGTTNAPSGAGAFPTTAGAFQTAYGAGYADAFVAKLNPSGTGLVYSTLVGGTGQDGGYGIAVGADGSAYFTGNFPNFHGCDGLATGRISPSGDALSWFTCTPGAVGHGVAVDPSGNVYVGGLAQAAMTTTSGVVQSTLQGPMYANNSFVEKLTSDGTLVYRTFLGGGAHASNSGEAIAVDAAGNAYLTGVSTAPFPATAGALQTASPGGNDAYVIKLNPTATAVVYATLLGGTNTDHGYGIAVDGAGHAYVTGEAAEGFPVTSDAAQSSFAGGFGDAFLSELAADGTSLVYSTYLGGNGQDSGHAAAMAPNGNVLIAGGAGGPFPVTIGAADTTASSGAFVAEVGAPVPGGGGTITTGGGGGTTTSSTDPSGTPAPTTTAPGLVLTLTTSHGDHITVTTAEGQEAYAELDRHLLGGLSGDDMARLLANGGFSVQIPLTYPAYPGAYSGSGSASPSGIPGYNGQGVGGGSPVGYDSAAKKKAKPVVLFSFTKHFAKLGTYTFKVKLTKAGTKLLRAAVKAKKKLKVSVSVSVAAKGHETVRHTSSVTLKPGKAKRGK